MSDRPQNKHLKPWRPGQSGNPKGRPKRLSWRRLTLAQTAEHVEAGLNTIDPVTGRERSDLVVEALITVAIEGNYHAIKAIFDLVDGPI